MKRVIALLCLALGLVTILGAQENPQANVAPSKEDVLRFFALMHLNERMHQLMDGMKAGMKTGAEAALKAKIANPPVTLMQKVDAIADGVFGDMPFDEMLDAMVPIYQKHLSKSDLDAIVAFYSSPTGQKLLKEQPAMMAEGMQAGQEVMLRHLPELQERINTKVAELVNQELGISKQDQQPKAN
jgi:hypothetical protein